VSAITSLRNALEGVTDEAEDRVIGVLKAIESAILTFVSAIFGAVELATHQVVQVFFDLTQTFVIESFSVVDSVVTAALGAATNEEEELSEEEIIAVIDSAVDNTERSD